MLFMMPTMLLGMPAIMTLRTLPEGAVFLEAWLQNVANTVPMALLMVLVVGGSVRFIVTRFLIQAGDTT